MKKRSILICVDWFPPAFRAGGPIRSVEHLSKFISKYVDVWILTSTLDLDGTVLEVEQNNWVKYADNVVVRYVSPEINMPRLFLRVMQEKQPDTIYLNSIFSLRFALVPLFLNKAKFQSKTIVAPRGMLGEGALALKRFKKRLFLNFSKAIGLFDSVLWHASTSIEAKEIEAEFRNARVNVAKNIPIRIEKKTVQRDFDCIELVFVGRISRKKNLSFALEALERANLNSTFNFRIIGSFDDEYLPESLIDRISKLPNVNLFFEGSIGHQDIQSAYRKAHYLVLPTLHENFGHVIVEAWAYGCPVIISDKTPWIGLSNLKIGWDIPLDLTAWIRVLQEIDSYTQCDWEILSKNSQDYFFERVFSEADEQANLALFDL